MARAARRDPGRSRLRADREARAAGCRRGARLRLARRARRRGARKGGLVRYLGIAAVWLYRLTFGALFPTTCKYHPSCSEYAIQALRRYGLVRGSVLAGWRLLRCNPWSRGGVDYPGGNPGSPLSPLLLSGLGWRRVSGPPVGPERRG